MASGVRDFHDRIFARAHMDRWMEVEGSKHAGGVEGMRSRTDGGDGFVHGGGRGSHVACRVVHRIG